MKYCKNCEWYNKLYDKCSYKKFIIDVYYNKQTGITTKWKNYIDNSEKALFRKFGKTAHDTLTLNIDNNCEYYERIWWKFWVKEIE